MKKIISMVVSVLMIISMMGCSGTEGASSKLSIKADGLSIEPGKTKLQDLIDAGYTYKWSDIFEPVDMIKGKTFITVSIDIFKGEELYVSVGLINKTPVGSKPEECTISDTRIYFNNKDHHQFSEVIVNNENIVGAKLDDIKTKFQTDSITEHDDSILFNYDGYVYEFGFGKDNIITDVTLDIDEHEM